MVVIVLNTTTTTENQKIVSVKKWDRVSCVVKMQLMFTNIIPQSILSFHPEDPENLMPLLLVNKGLWWSGPSGPSQVNIIDLGLLCMINNTPWAISL